MKNFKEYLDSSWSSLYQSAVYENFGDKLTNQEDYATIISRTCEVAMQLAKQDADRELALQRHELNVEIEYLRSRLKHFTPASESSQKYLSMLQNTDEKKLIVANYVKGKNTTVPALNQSEVSELIDMLKKGDVSANK